MRRVRVREIERADFEGFHTCLDSVARERRYLGFTTAPSLEATRRWLQEGMDKAEIRLVAVDGDRVIGWCDIEVSQREGFEHTGRLGMGVLKDFRGQGIGDRLIRKSLELARSQDLERVELDVYASNAAAIGLYEKYGFLVEGQRKKARKLDGTYDDIIGMALFLSE